MITHDDTVTYYIVVIGIQIDNGKTMLTVFSTELLDTLGEAQQIILIAWFVSSYAELDFGDANRGLYHFDHSRRLS